MARNFKAHPKKKSNIMQVDHETGNIVIPGKEPMPLIGPTTGTAYKYLQEQEQQKREANEFLIGIMQKTWRCIQCGTVYRTRWLANGKPNPKFPAVQINLHTGIPSCSDPRCQAPVIEIPAQGSSRVQ